MIKFIHSFVIVLALVLANQLIAGGEQFEKLENFKLVQGLIVNNTNHTQSERVQSLDLCKQKCINDKQSGSRCIAIGVDSADNEVKCKIIRDFLIVDAASAVSNGESVYLLTKRMSKLYAEAVAKPVTLFEKQHFVYAYDKQYKDIFKHETSKSFAIELHDSSNVTAKQCAVPGRGVYFSCIVINKLTTQQSCESNGYLFYPPSNCVCEKCERYSGGYVEIK